MNKKLNMRKRKPINWAKIGVFIAIITLCVDSYFKWVESNKQNTPVTISNNIVNYYLYCPKVGFSATLKEP